MRLPVRDVVAPPQLEVMRSLQSISAAQCVVQCNIVIES